MAVDYSKLSDAELDQTIARLQGGSGGTPPPSSDLSAQNILPAGNRIEMVDTSQVKHPRASLTHKQEDLLSQDDLLTSARANAQDIAQSVIKSGGNLTRDQYTQLILNQYDDAVKLNTIPARKVLPDAMLADASSLAMTPKMMDHLQQLHQAAIEDHALGFGGLGNQPGYLPNRQTAIAYDTYMQSLVPVIARGLQQQTGPLSNDDIANAKKQLPVPGDSPATVATKIREIKALVQANVEGKVSTLKDYFDTSPLENVDSILKHDLGQEADKISQGNPAGDHQSKFDLYDQNQGKLSGLQGQPVSPVWKPTLSVMAPREPAPAPAPVTTYAGETPITYPGGDKPIFTLPDLTKILRPNDPNAPPSFSPEVEGQPIPLRPTEEAQRKRRDPEYIGQ